MSDFYPMSGFPTLAVRDLAASRAWYEALGFTTVFVMPGPGGTPGLVHLRWARHADLMLRAAAPDEGPKGRGVTLTFAFALATAAAETDADGLDALAIRARKMGSPILREPGDRPWNARDFSVADPDGYALVFTFGPVDRDLDIGQVADQVRRA